MPSTEPVQYNVYKYTKTLHTQTIIGCALVIKNKQKKTQKKHVSVLLLTGK